MVETITPVVHGGSRRRWASALLFHVAGATLSAAALGAVIGGIGEALGAPWGPAGALVGAAVALLYLGREAFGVPVPVLEARRQVPQWWREAFSPETAALLYGTGLGVGFATHLGHGTLVAVAAAVAISGDPVAGAVAVGAFGVARALGVGVTWAASDNARARVVAERLERVAVGPVPRLANGLALAAIAAGAGWVAARSSTGGPAGVVPAVVLAAVFGSAAVAKTLRPAAWRAVLDGHALPAPVRFAALIGIPVAEATVAFLVLAGSIRAAAATALGLLVLFTTSLLRLRALRGDRVPCGCFGRSRTRSVRVLMIRNVGLGVVAAVALAGPDRLPGLRAPGLGEVVPAALAALGLLLAAAMARRAMILLRDVRPPALG
jgi:hypothetical protein